MELAETISQELNRYAPDLSTPEIGAMTAALVASGAYRLQDGKLIPGPRQAVEQSAHFTPHEFREAIARSAAESEQNPAMRTQRYYEGLGSSFDDALAGDMARANGRDGAFAELADAIQVEVAGDDAIGAKTREWSMKNFKGPRQ